MVIISCNLFDSSDDDMFDYNSIELSDFIIDNYYEDAMELYFREIKADSTHPNYNNPIFDTDEIDKIMKIIQVVYNSSSSQRGVVFETYDIHTHPSQEFNTLLVGVDTSATEIKNFIAGNIPTGNDELDSIIVKFHFDCVWVFQIIPTIIISSSENYNLFPIMKALEKISLIHYAEPNYCGGDGNNITLNRDINSPKITFSRGYGDCPAGCTSHDYWEFQIIGSRAKFIRKY